MPALPAAGQPDYGQDAPGIRMGMFVISGVGSALLLGGWLASISWRGAPGQLVLAIEVLGGFAALYGAWMAAYMTWASRVGKLRTRDDLLRRAGELRRWKGDEVAVDVGCGRGLMLVGAAKRLRRGIAMGFDVWREEDQANNSAEAALENARIEGVADRIEVQTGDARDLPLADGSADVVMSHWVIHNLQTQMDRTKALDEMWRVLRSGGVLVLADIEHVPFYFRYLTALGARQCVMLDGSWEARIMGVLSGGTYCPQSLICLRP